MNRTKRGANRYSVRAARILNQNQESLGASFQILPAELLEDVVAQKISVTAYFFYAFCLWQPPDTYLSFNRELIGKQCKLPEATIKRVISELLEAGHITPATQRDESLGIECRGYETKIGKIFWQLPMAEPAAPPSI